MTDDTLRALAIETHDTLKAMNPCRTKNCAGCQRELAILEAALQQAQALQREADAQLAETNGCTSAGCWTTDGHNNHTLSCPVGIAALLRRSAAPVTPDRET